MKITEVRVILTSPGRNFVVVKVMTDEGVYGVGDATCNGREKAVVAALSEHIAPALIGMDPDRVEDIWQFLFRGTYWRGGPILNSALSGIDMALWDIKGKVAGRPVFSLLGGKTRERCRVYSHASGTCKEEVLDSCRALMERGITALRVNIMAGQGASIGHNNTCLWDPAAHVREVPRFIDYIRSNLPEEIDLIYDVHERLLPMQAAQVARDLEPYRLFYLEDPLRPENPEAFRLLRQYSTTPIAMGELYSSLWECLPLIVNQWIDYIRVDLERIGGITAARKLATLGEPYYVRTAWHGPHDLTPIGQAANVHVDTAVPNFGIQEWFLWDNILNREGDVVWFTGDQTQVKSIFPGGAVFRDGFVYPSEAPGLGVDVDEDAAARFPYKFASIGSFRLAADMSVTDW